MAVGGNSGVVRGQCWDLKPKASAFSVVSEKIRVEFEVAVIDFLANLTSRFRSGLVHLNRCAPMDK